MGTQEEIQQAYNIVYENEKKVFLDLDAKINAAIADLDALGASIPELGTTSTVKALISRLRNNLVTTKNMEMSPIYLQYGLGMDGNPLPPAPPVIGA